MCRSRTEWKISDISAWKSHSGSIVAAVCRSQAGPQQPQPLDRVDRVHRDLQRQVDVVLLQQHQRLVDDELALVSVSVPAVLRKSASSTDADSASGRLRNMAARNTVTRRRVFARALARFDRGLTCRERVLARRGRARRAVARTLGVRRVRGAMGPPAMQRANVRLLEVRTPRLDPRQPSTPRVDVFAIRRTAQAGSRARPRASQPEASLAVPTRSTSADVSPV